MVSEKASTGAGQPKKKIHISIKLIGLVIALGLGGYGVYYYFFKDKTKDTDNKNTSSGSSGGGKSSSKANTGSTSVFPLTNGSKGDEVKRLQVWLNNNLKIKGQPAIATDGIFGAETASALNTITGSTSMTQDYFNNAKI